MVPWKFFDYIGLDGQNYTQNWYSEQDRKVRVQFDFTLFLLRGTSDWTDRRITEFKLLTERHIGLGEIVFDVEAQDGKRRFKRHFRPVGIWRPDYRDFIILIGCEKSGRIYAPLNAFDLALRYKSEFEQGKGTLYERL